MEKQLNKVNIAKNKKIIIYVVLLLVLIYIGYTIYLLIKQPTDVFTIEEGKLYLEETNIGYVIRDEQVIQGENYKNGMEKLKAEGEKVAKNEPAFRYYSKNEETLKNKIAQLDVKIQEVMGKETDLLPSDMKLIENQLDEKMRDLNKMTDVSQMEECKKEISELITKKANIAGAKSPKGSYFNQLIEERRKYESELNSGAEYVKAPVSGIVSYKVDGLEKVLKPTTECFSTLSKQYLESLELKTGKVVATSEECGKIIDNSYCYIATVSNSEQAKTAQIGQKNVKVRLPNNEEIPADIVYTVQEDENSYLIVLKVEKQIEELTNYRKISFDLIWWSDSGLKVPNQAIAKDGDLDYVVRERAGYLSKILVKVKRQAEKYSIVEPYDADDLRKLGFSNEEIASYKKISLYDEVILNPDLSKVK